jgi:hypothetical protein
MMNQIDKVLERYEGGLRKLDKGQCNKTSECVEFRNQFREKFRQEYGPKLYEMRKKLSGKNHRARVDERPHAALFYTFEMAVIPNHFFRFPLDRYYHRSPWSTITFVANEDTLTVDVEMLVRPKSEKQEYPSVEKIPKDEFSSDLLVEKVHEFVARVFDQTTILDFKDQGH